MDEAVVSAFQRSLGRCLNSGDFMQSFYDRFLGSSPEVRERFANTDFAKQKGILKSSLYLMARAALGLEDGREHLEEIAHEHGRRRLDISPHLYELWLESLIATAREHDPGFEDAVEDAWRELLTQGIDHMVAVYRQNETKPPAPEGA